MSDSYEETLKRLEAEKQELIDRSKKLKYELNLLRSENDELKDKLIKLNKKCATLEY